MAHFVLPYLRRVEMSDYEIEKRKKFAQERVEEERKHKKWKEEQKRKEVEEKIKNREMLSFYPWESDYGKLPKLRQTSNNLKYDPAVSEIILIVKIISKDFYP